MDPAPSYSAAVIVLMSVLLWLAEMGCVWCGYGSLYCGLL